jgi:D-alanyl-D-alanine carboxypeptidase
VRGLPQVRRPNQFIAAFAALSLAVACGPSAGGSPSATSGGPPSDRLAVPEPSATRRPSPTPRPTPTPFDYLPALPTVPLDATAAAALQKVLDDLVAAGAPDAIGAVITADGQWSGAAGVDGPNGRAATIADEFNIGSISKIIQAALILRLAETGRIDLDAPISGYLGELPIDSNDATVREVLAMRSGIGDTSAELLAQARKDCGRVWTRNDTLISIPAPHAKAGAAYEYSNPSYKLLGYATEQVTGMPLETAFDELMFNPVSLDRILLQGPTQPAEQPWALPIEGHAGSIDLAAYGTGGTLPCIGLSTFSFGSAVASDASSLARWGWGLFSGALLNRDSLTAMWASRLGIERLPDFADPAFGTRGHQEGYNSFLVVLPTRQISAVLFINEGAADVQLGVRSLVNALAR